MPRLRLTPALVAMAALFVAEGCGDPCANAGVLQAEDSGCPAFDPTAGVETETGSAADASESGDSSCNNGVSDPDESDIDCGGSCEVTCAAGQGCQTDDDCGSSMCNADMAVCMAPSCDDARHNGDEEDVDCGGSSCDPCESDTGPDPLDCQDSSDCDAGICQAGTCVPETCDDGMLGGNETDIDCGGDSCSPCEAGQTCAAAADCDSVLCASDTNTCVAAACDDGTQNGTETDTDCGGSCSPCADDSSCSTGSDCTSGVCDADTCTAPACDDNTLNGTETDTDCGGSCGATCENGSTCEAAEDCSSGICDGSNVCAALDCSNGVQDGPETDVDCGAACGATCSTGQMCTAATDCVSDSCDAGTNLCAGAIVFAIDEGDAAGLGVASNPAAGCSVSITPNGTAAGSGTLDQSGGILHWRHNVNDGLASASITVDGMLSVTQIVVEMSSFNSGENLQNFSLTPDDVSANGNDRTLTWDTSLAGLSLPIELTFDVQHVRNGNDNLYVESISASGSATCGAS